MWLSPESATTSNPKTTPETCEYTSKEPPDHQSFRVILHIIPEQFNSLTSVVLPQLFPGLLRQGLDYFIGVAEVAQEVGLQQLPPDHLTAENVLTEDACKFGDEMREVLLLPLPLQVLPEHHHRKYHLFAGRHLSVVPPHVIRSHSAPSEIFYDCQNVLLELVVAALHKVLQLVPAHKGREVAVVGLPADEIVVVLDAGGVQSVGGHYFLAGGLPIFFLQLLQHHIFCQYQYAPLDHSLVGEVVP